MYDFMLKICESKKRAFEKTELAQASSLNYRELRMQAVLRQELLHPLLESYLPDKKREVFKVDEKFFLLIVAKIEPDWFKSVAKATFDKRYEPRN